MPAASFSFISMANEITVKPSGQFTGPELSLRPQTPVTFLYTGKYPFGFPRLAPSWKMLVTRQTKFLNQSKSESFLSLRSASTRYDKLMKFGGTPFVKGVACKAKLILEQLVLERMAGPAQFT